MPLALVLALAFALANLLSFALVGLDKRRARRRLWRISERTLLLAALVSGTVGAWAAVFAFRHKTRKPSFLLPLALASAIDLAVVYLVLTRL